MVGRKEAGLISLNESRRNRRRQMATGRAAIGGLPLRLFSFGFLLLLGAGFVYYRVQASKLEEQRAALLAKQRAVEATLGPKLGPLQRSVEQHARALASQKTESFVKAGVDFASLLRSPGVYLRLPQADVEPQEKLKKAAMSSLRDGFSACLVADPRASAPGVGKACKESAECATGELCTEFKVCQRPGSPFNMRLLYRATSVLESGWVDAVRAASSDLGLVAQDRMLESITKVDVPLAIEVYQRARFALVVLDEPFEGKSDEKADASESPAELLQRLPHRAKVGLWSLPDGELLASLRAEALGELRDVGRERAPGGLESAHTRTRLANSCALALEFKEHLAPAPSGAVAP
jgi:hypothetical protein